MSDPTEIFESEDLSPEDSLDEFEGWTPKNWQEMIRQLVDGTLIHHELALEEMREIEKENEHLLLNSVRDGRVMFGDIDDYGEKVMAFLPPGTRVNIVGRKKVNKPGTGEKETLIQTTRGRIQEIKGETHGVIPTFVELTKRKQILMNEVSIAPVYKREKELLNQQSKVMEANFIKEKPTDQSLPFQQMMSGEFVIEPEDELQQHPQLDEKQNEAFGRAMQYDKYPVLWIWGGPGTGKTRTTAEIVKGHLDQKRKILVLSHSNKGSQKPAIELQKIMGKKEARGKTHVLGTQIEKIDPALHTCRIRRGAMNFPEKELLRLETMTLEEAALEYFPEEGMTGEEIIDEVGKEKVENVLKAERVNILQKYDEDIKKRVEKTKKDMEKKGGVLVSTFDSFMNDQQCQEMEFDVVIIDEATHMNMPHAVKALEKAGKQIIIIGDPLQLGHLPLSPNRKELVKYALRNPDQNTETLSQAVRDKINEVIYSVDEADQVVERVEEGIFTRAILEAKDPEKELPLVFLDQDRRSLPKIVTVLSELIYEGKLKPGRFPQEGEHEGIVRWYDTKNLKSQEKTSGTSKRNIQEADIIVKRILHSMKTDGVLPDEIGVIATYASQADLIRKKLRRYLWYDKSKPENKELYKKIEPNIATVDAFQGDERRMIFVSLTRSNEEGSIGFLEEEKRLGVAIGRAQEALYIYGDSDTVVERNQNLESKVFFEKMKKLVEENGEIIELQSKKS